MGNKYIYWFMAFGLLAIVSAGQPPQTITLYESTEENSFKQTFTNNVRNLANDNDNKLGNITKACVPSKGIWMYYTKANYSNADGGIAETLIYTNNTSNYCKNITNANITSIRHIGHSDLSMSAISFYTADKMQDGLEFYFEGYKLILPENVKVNSYGFTGKKNWIISDNVPSETAEGQKKPYCLDITRMEDNITIDTLAYKQQNPLTFKYIQRCCTGNEDIVVPDGSAGRGDSKTANMTEEADAMNGPGLILTVKLSANEIGELTLIGNKLGLIRPIQITNFTFIGERCFTIYESIDFVGTGKCLVPGTKFMDEQYGNKTEHTVGSIMIGCGNGSNNSAFMISAMQIMFSTLLAIFVIFF